MEPLTVTGLMIVLLLVGIFLGFHIGVSLFSVSIIGIWLIIGDIGTACQMLGNQPFYAVFDYILSVIPLFILMGLLVNLSGAGNDLYNAANAWVGEFRGGLGIATVLANGIFAAISGISVASAAMFSKVALPQMLRFGYSKRISLGTIAGSSVLGMLIPPSVLLILYGVLAEVSIGKLFIAGLIPGLLLLVVYSIGIRLMMRFFTDFAGKTESADKIKIEAKLKISLKTSGLLGLIVLVLGGIYAGIFTPTEAGGVGTVGALLLFLFRHSRGIKELKHALNETGVMTASFFFLLIGAQLFSRMLTISGTVSTFAEFVIRLSLPPLLIIGLLLVILMILGAILDCMSIMIIVLPIILPTVEALGFDLIWFGIVSVIAIETGLITPPFGMVPFTIKASIGDTASLEDIFIGAFPFLLMMICVIMILILCPFLITWLPGTM